MIKVTIPSDLNRSFSRNFQSLMGGRVFTRFVRKNRGVLIYIFVLTLFYITNKYQGEKEVTQIMSLKSRVVDVKYELQTVNSSLVGRSRQSQVLEKLRREGLDLAPANRPPYELKR